MATFPDIKPLHPIDKSVSPLQSKTRLGDGYVASFRFGLNTIRPEWNLEWLVDEQDTTTINTFLRTAANGADFFQWQPPDQTVTLNWRCDEWFIDQVNDDIFSVKAVFRQVFDLATHETITVSASCPEDGAICGTRALMWPVPFTGWATVSYVHGYTRTACNTGEVLTDYNFSGSIEAFVNGAWVDTARSDLNNPGTYIKAKGSDFVPCGTPAFSRYMNINGAVVYKPTLADEKIYVAVWGANRLTTADSYWASYTDSYISAFVLTVDVPGLGLAGDNVVNKLKAYAAANYNAF